MPFLLLTLYSVLIVAVSLAGGLLPLLVRLTHRRMQMAVSFVSGVMLGVAFFHLLPHALEKFGHLGDGMVWVAVGFLVTFFLQRFVAIHHHVAPHEDEDEDEEHSDIHAGHGHGHEAKDLAADRFSWSGAFLGLTLHTLIAGFALAAAVDNEWHTTGAHFAGVAIFLAILFHKPFDSLTIITLMAAGGWSKRACHLVNGFFSLMIPLGVLLFYLGVSQAGDAEQRTLVLGIALSISAGVFLCFAASDLLPEMHFHSHDRVWLSVFLVLGVVLAWGIEVAAHRYEHKDHHEHPADDHHGHDHGWLDAPGDRDRPGLILVHATFGANLRDAAKDRLDDVVVGSDVADLHEQ